jgi:hypothetical protein
MNKFLKPVHELSKYGISCAVLRELLIKDLYKSSLIQLEADITKITKGLQLLRQIQKDLQSIIQEETKNEKT